MMIRNNGEKYGLQKWKLRCFRWIGETDPTKSDFRYYASIQAWAAERNMILNM